MTRRMAVLTAWSLFTTLAVGPAVYAADQPADIDTQTLLERLERAESRIQSLETDLSNTRMQQPAAPGSAFVSLQPAPPAERLADEHGDSLLDPTSLFDDAPEGPRPLEEQFAELQEQQKTLQDNYDKLSGRLKKGLVFPGSTNVTMKLSGRIHADYWAFPGTDDFINGVEMMNPQDRFIFRRVRFGVSGDIGDHMRYKIEIEFAGGTATQYRDVYLGWTHLPFLQTVLVGNQKRPYGLDHMNSSRFNVFMERPLVIEGFNQDSRRLGICSYGVSKDEAWNWRYGVFNLELTQADDGYIGDNYQLEAAGRLANTYWYDEASNGRGYGHWAIAGTIADPAGHNGPTFANEARFRTRPEARTDERWLNTGRIAGAQWYELVALEKVLNVGPVQFVGELQNLFLQRKHGAGSDLHFWGGYAYVAYFLTGEHMPWERDSGTLGRPKPFENFFMVDRCTGGHGGGWGAWQIAARYSYADFSNNDILGGVGNSVTLGLNWYWNPNARVQFNYLHGWIADHAPVTAAMLTEGEYDIVGMRAMVDF